MATNYGEDIARTYLLPQDQYTMPQYQYQGPGAGQGQSFELPPIEEGLQNVDGITESYFNKYGELEQFLGSLYAKGIDPSKPDYSNPETREAMNVLYKAMADVRYTGDQLKNSQKMLEAYQGHRAANQVAPVDGYDVNQAPFSHVFDQNVASTATPLADTSNKAYAKAFGTTSAKNQANKQVAENLAILEERMVNETNPSIKQQLQYEIDELQQAIRDPKVFSPYSGGRGRITPDIVTERSNIIAMTQGGNMSYLEADEDVKSARFNPMNGTIVVEYKTGTSNGRTVYSTTEIDVRSQDGGFQQINDFLNRRKGAFQITDEHFAGLTNRLRDVGDSGPRALGDIPQDYFDQENRVIAALSNKKGNKEAGVSKSDHERYLNAFKSLVKRGEAIMPEGVVDTKGLQSRYGETIQSINYSSPYFGKDKLVIKTNEAEYIIRLDADSYDIVQSIIRENPGVVDFENIGKQRQVQEEATEFVNPGGRKLKVFEGMK